MNTTESQADREHRHAVATVRQNFPHHLAVQLFPCQRQPTTLSWRIPKMVLHVKEMLYAADPPTAWVKAVWPVTMV